MSLIESGDILNKLCSNDYYRGDNVKCAIQCLAEGKAIGRVRTLEDVGQTVIDEKLKDDLMKSKDNWDVPDNMKWLLPLLLFPPASDPPRREISVTANVNGKSVIITYDPHNSEAVKAAETWRKALFAPKDAPKDGNCLYVSDKVRYALDAIAYLSGNIDGRYAFIPLTDKQREAIDALYEDLHSREPFDEANLFKPGSYEPKDLPTKHNRMTELEKAAGPLRTYLKIHGDPHTSVIVTQDGATVKQGERGVKFDNEMTLEQCLQNAYDSLKAEPQSQKHGTWQETLLRILDTHMARRNSLNVPLQMTLPSEVVVSLRNWLLGNAS